MRIFFVFFKNSFRYIYFVPDGRVRREVQAFLAWHQPHWLMSMQSSSIELLYTALLVYRERELRVKTYKTNIPRVVYIEKKKKIRTGAVSFSFIGKSAAVMETLIFFYSE
jgi:hypothetical protein